ncbi:MAG TPA: PRC-barrel domain-containing protein [Microvirga sp.]|jgi:hypothetical protein|nr:PRC-barrel domain-containing protein [Microvirga sp.]
MRTTILAVLLGSTALAAAAFAQSQSSTTAPVPEGQTQSSATTALVPEGQAQAKAAIAECDRLLAFLDPNRPTAGVTVERAREWKANSDADACRSALDRLTQASGGSPPQPLAGTPSTSPAGPPLSPAASTAPGGALPAPQVVVQQQQPSVTVRQAKPEIIVRIPPPVITVQQPQPEIIVRMPEPDVNVAVARPEVQVTIPQPQVQVRPAGPEANVKVERQEPNVRIERTGEPQIVYRQAEGQPQIRFEPVGGDQAAQAAPGAAAATTPGAGPAPVTDSQRAQAQLNNPQTGYGTHTPSGNAADRSVQGAAPGPQTTGALPAGDFQALTASRLADMTLYNAREEKLGEVEAVVSDGGGRTLLVVSHGGFLGLGEKRVAVPVEHVALRGDRLIADGLTDDQIRALPGYERGAGLRELEGSGSARIRILR